MAGFWDRHVVPHIVGFCCSQPAITEQRMKVVPRARGRVLELGAGGGANLALYDRQQVSSVIGIDPSDELRARAEERMRPEDRGFFEIAAGRAEDLPFASGTFDTVVTTYTLCSVSDQARALAEARRVLKPGGQLLFLEHGRAPDEGPRKWQQRLEPVWKRLMGNCHLTRTVADSVAAAGFKVGERHGFYMEKMPQCMGWMEWGVAAPN
ncbi:MAG: class I SAM-dependent methyltransferase [Sphingomonadales bacterium]